MKRMHSLRLLPLLLAGCFGLVSANPTGQKVVAGQATFQQQGNVFTITNTPNTIINWQNFSVNAGEVTRFVQQNADSAVLNRVTGQDPSQILGALQSNGRVFVINPNGILFGRNAQVDVNGLVASSLNISDSDFLAGKHKFQAGEKAGAVKNEGRLNGGSVYLLAPNVENAGVITTPQGDVVLAAGQSVELVDSRNPELHVVVSAPADQAINLGQVVAQGGRIGIYGALVNQRGTLNANSAVRGENGKIVLKASRDTLLEAGSRTTATGAGTGGTVHVLGERVALTGDALVDVSGEQGGGTALIGGDYRGENKAVKNASQTTVGAQASVRADALASGDGGRVIVWSDDVTRFQGDVRARGGSIGGNGGFVETSGKRTLLADGIVQVGALKGRAGEWLLDPFDLTIVTGSVNTTITGDGATSPFGATNIGSQLSLAALNTALDALAGSGIITLQASGDITVNAAVSTSNSNNVTLKLYSQGSINFGASGSLTAAGTGKMNVELKAGMNAGYTTAGSVEAAVNMGSRSISTNGGNVDIVAKKDTSSSAVVALGAINTGSTGYLHIDSKNGDISQNGTLTIGGNTIVDAQNGMITLGYTANQFTGGITASAAQGVILSGTSNGAINLASSAGAVTFGHVHALDTLSVTAFGINQASTGTTGLETSGTATFNAGNGGVNLTQSTNVLSGPIYSTTTGSGAIALANGGTTPLSIAGINTAGGGLTLDAYGLTQTGAIIVGGTGTTSLGAKAGGIVLTDSGNSFGGTVSAGAINNGNISVRTSGEMKIAGISTGGAVGIQAGSGITQTGSIYVGQATTLNGGTGDIVLTNSANDFSNTPASAGAVTATTSGGTISLVDVNDITLGQVNTTGTGGNFSVTARSITQDGAGLYVGGDTTLSAGAGKIELLTANEFTGKVSASNAGTEPAHHIKLLDNDSIKLGNITTPYGLYVTAGGTGTITQEAGASIVAGGSGGVISLNAPGAIDLSNSGNVLRAPVSAANAAGAPVKLTNYDAGGHTLTIAGISSTGYTTLRGPSIAITGTVTSGWIDLVATGLFSNTGNITPASGMSATAGKMALGTAPASIVTNSLTLAGTDGNAIVLGSTTDAAAGTLELSAQEIATIATPFLTIGSTGAGNVTVTAPVSFGAIGNGASVRTGGDITVNSAGSLSMNTATPGALALYAGNAGKITHNGALSAYNVILSAPKMAVNAGINVAGLVNFGSPIANGIILGGAETDTNTALELSAAELNRITGVSMIIGHVAVPNNDGPDNPGTGTLTVAGTVAPAGLSGGMQISASGNVTVNGLLSTGSAGLILETNGGAILQGAGGKVKAGTLTLRSTAGIGTATALQTETALLTAENTHANGTTPIRIANNDGLSSGGALAVSGVRQLGTNNAGLIDLQNKGAMTVPVGGQVSTGGNGSIALVARSPLTINGSVSSGSGTVLLEAGASGSPTDDLTINGSVNTTGPAVFKAGDAVTIASSANVTTGAQTTVASQNTSTPALTLSACLVAPSTSGCVTLAASCVATPSGAACNGALPTLSTCSATPAATGCTLLQALCAAAPSTAGCTATAPPPPPPPPPPTCAAEPTAANCTGPSLAQCTVNPAASGCAAILPSLSACLAVPTTAGCAAVLPSLAACTANPQTPGCAAVVPSLESCVANPAAAGCAAILPPLSACLVAPSTTGCSAVLPTLSACVAAPATPGCSVVLPSVSACTANPVAPGCTDVLPSFATCTAAPATPGCSVVLPSLDACKLNPNAAGCTVVLPTLSACTSAPSTPGCSAVLPSVTACAAAPSTPGCSAVLPSVAVCTANPSAPGCTAVLPTLAACTSAPATAGCSAVLPSLATCAATPSLAGCTAVLPTVAACTANPAAAGCNAVLPTLAACTSAPATAGCAAVLPSLASCAATPSLAGCTAVLPTLTACTANPAQVGCQAVLPAFSACLSAPATPGCAAVLPSLGACTASPTTNGCSAVLPTLGACTANPAAAGCSAVLPPLSACVSNPSTTGCAAVLPTLNSCAANPAQAGCSVVLPTLSTCTSTPSTAGCAAVLPSLASCTASPTQAGCSAVLPPVDTCATNPSAPGCVVVLPPTQGPSTEPVAQAVNTTVNLINTTVTPQDPAPFVAPVVSKPASPPPAPAAAPAAGSSSTSGSSGSSSTSSSSSSAPAGSTPGPASTEKTDEKKEDPKDAPAPKASEEKKSEPVKKMYCN